MTTDQWVDEVYSDWGESSTNSIISPAEITAWGNRAQRELCVISNVLLQCAKGPFVAGQETYNLPDNYLKIEAVFLTKDSGAPNWLKPMDVADRDPSEPQGTPTHYYPWGQDVNGSNQYIIGFQQIPGTSFPAAPTKSWECFYRKRARTMVHSTQGSAVAPEVLPEFQDWMRDFALGMIYRRLGRDFQGAFATQMGLWREHREDAKKYINPLTFDYPTPRRDTAGLTQEFY